MCALSMVSLDYFVILPALGRVRGIRQTVLQVVVESIVIDTIQVSMVFADAKRAPHHHVHQITDLRGGQEYFSGLHG